MRALLLLLAAVAVAGCRAHGSYVTIHNGGVPAPEGRCTEAMLIDRAGNADVLLPNAAGCADLTGFLLPREATVAFWKIVSSPFAGPAVSNRVELKTPVPLTAADDGRALSSGEAKLSLAGGDDERVLSSGNDSKALTASQDNKSLTGGNNQSGLTAGSSQRDLSGGATSRGLSSGQNQQGLTSGADTRQLSAGGSQRPVLAIRKTVDREELDPGEEATFILGLSTGDATLSQLVIVDHLPAGLTPGKVGTARVVTLPDGTSVLVWQLPGPIAPDTNLKVTFTVRLSGSR